MFDDPKNFQLNQHSHDFSIISTSTPFHMGTKKANMNHMQSAFQFFPTS